MEEIGPRGTVIAACFQERGLMGHQRRMKLPRLPSGLAYLFESRPMFLDQHDQLYLELLHSLEQVLDPISLPGYVLALYVGTEVFEHLVAAPQPFGHYK